MKCTKCIKNDVEIFNSEGNFCTSCWEDLTDPSTRQLIQYQ